MKFSGFFSLLLVAWCSSSTLHAKDPIVLGTSAAFKGPSRALGIELYRGSIAYFDKVNQAGGVGGRLIELRLLDDGYQPEPTLKNTIHLIEKENVFCLYNYVGTPTVVRILPLLKALQHTRTYLFFPFTGAGPQRSYPYDQYVFNLRTSYAQETHSLVDNFVACGRKRIGVFYQSDAYGRSGWSGVRAALSSHGLKIHGEATYKRGMPYDSDMGAQVGRLKEAGVNAIVMVGAYAACAAFIRDARKEGWQVPVANLSFVGSENLLALLLRSEKDLNLKLTDNLINSQVVPSYHDLDYPAVKEYRALMKKAPKAPAAFRDGGYRTQDLSFVSFEGFLNAKLMVEFLRKFEGDFNRKRIPEITMSLTGIDLGIGEKLRYSTKDNQGLDKVYLTSVVKNKYVGIRDFLKWKIP